MRIHHFDGADRSLLAESRPPPSTPPPREAARNVTVMISSEVRALVSALTRSLPGALESQIDDILTQADRLTLACAASLVHAQGADPAELDGLVRDLAAHRLSALARPRRADEAVADPLEAGAVGATAAPLSALLALPRFSEVDEAAARALLSRLALRDTQVDRGFVRALLDPDLRPTHTVRLAFLDRIVTALSPAYADARVDPAVSFVRRDARAALGAAVAALGLSRAELTRDLSALAPLGPDLLRARAQLLDPDAAHLGGGAAWRTLVRLTRDDRALLGMLYASAHARGGDLRAVDDVLTALVTLRSAEQRDQLSAAVSGRLQMSAPESADAADDGGSTRAGAPSSHGLRTHLAAHPTGATADGSPAAPADGTESPSPRSEPAESSARSFGSASQIAARLHASYRHAPASWGPPLAASPSGTPSPNAGSLATATAHPVLGGGAAAPFVPPPLHLAEALGLATLVSALHAQGLRARRLRSLRGRARVTQEGARAEGGTRDAQIVDERLKRRRARWRRFVRRRTRRRRS